jgi:hypothetical protein
MAQRRFDIYDVKHAISGARQATPYSDPARAVLPAGTTSWRIFGRDMDGDPLDLGVDLTVDHMGNTVVVMTGF